MNKQTLLIVSSIAVIISIIAVTVILKHKSQPIRKKTFRKKAIENVAYQRANIKGYEIHGMDVSHHQGSINWKKVKHPDASKTIDFVFIRATVGTRVDRTFYKNWKESKQNGFSVGAYHYYWPNINSTVQANNFINKVSLEKGDLPPVLDIEKLPTVQSTENLRKGLKNWIAIVENHYGMKPIIYTGDHFYMQNLWVDSYFRNYPRLWIANYNNVISPSSSWHFWQYSDRIKVSGINELVDMNVFDGDSTAINSLKLQ